MQLDKYPSREAWQVAWAVSRAQDHSSMTNSTKLTQPKANSSPQLLTSTDKDNRQASMQPNSAEPDMQALQSAIQGATSSQPQPLQDNSAAGPSSSFEPPNQASSDVQHAAANVQRPSWRLPTQPPKPWPLHVLRSSQLDAHRLDSELLSLIREQLQRALSQFHPGDIAGWEPELNALLRLLVFGFSILRGHATPGSMLLNLRYRSEPALSFPSSHHSNNKADSPNSDIVTSTQSSNAGASRESRPTGNIDAAGASVSQQTDQHVSCSVGGKTGVDGPGLSMPQRIALGLGIVVVPYLWSRLSTLLARASTEEVNDWSNFMDANQPPATTDNNRSSISHDDWEHASLHGQQEPTTASALSQPQPNEHAMKAHSSLLSLVFRRAFSLSRSIARVLVMFKLIRRWLTSKLLSPEFAWKAMRVLESTYRAVSLGNLLIFLAGGRYRTVLERLIGARLVYVQPVMTRIISFEYLNRQLVWQEVSELLLFVLPMLDAIRTRKTLARLLPRLPDPRQLFGWGPEGGTVTDRNRQTTSKPAAGSQANKQMRPEGPCPVCGSREMLTPVVAVPCGHCFCYFCLASHTAADTQYECPCDGVRVAAYERWKPGISVAEVP